MSTDLTSYYEETGKIEIGPDEQICPDCKGTGLTRWEDEDCPTCFGEGVLIFFSELLDEVSDVVID